MIPVRAGFVRPPGRAVDPRIALLGFPLGLKVGKFGAAARNSDGAPDHSLLEYEQWPRRQFSRISESTGFEPHPFKLIGLQQPRRIFRLARFSLKTRKKLLQPRMLSTSPSCLPLSGPAGLKADHVELVLEEKNETT